MSALSLMIYDRTCTRTGRLPVGLSHSWVWGGRLYGALGRFDAWKGVASWEEGLGWLAQQDAPIRSIQYWGHGNWGTARVADDRLDVRSLQPGHAHRRHLDAIRERLVPGDGWWFRTCDTLGAARGHDFARRWTDFFGTPVSGHTFIIGAWQSGLHRLSPGAAPHWSDTEGLSAGTADTPRASTWSRPGRPNTIHCLQSAIPVGW